jgi:ubiquinone/menaquinone biosynthesis C-methylase UbiE
VGLGTDLKQFARNGADCYGVDITDAHLSLARQNFATEGCKLTLQRGDATALPFPDGYFDCVYSFGVIHHIPDVDAVMREAHRVLKPGGLIQLAVYHRFSIHAVSLFLRAILSGQIARIGVSGVLATIEKGADGVTIKPYVKLYSAPGLRHLLRRHGFSLTRSGIRQVNFDETHRLHALRSFEKAIGWYVCAIAKKADQS